MDILSDILQTAGLRKRILNQREVPQGWQMDFPCDKSMGFHVILKGEVEVSGLAAPAGLKGKAVATPVMPQRLKAGDVLFMARGFCHQLTAPVEGGALVVSGAYQLWHDPVHPLFRSLPRWQVLPANTRQFNDGVNQALSLLTHEITMQDALGASAVSSALLDILFYYLLRETLSSHEGAWQRAIADAEVAQALQYMHQNPGENWNMEGLAQKVGLSRSGFALRFKQTLGDTPAHYLTTLRMSKAMQLLGETEHTLEQIASTVGYKDAFGFSKAFKKVVGENPAAFRRKNREEATLSWRFQEHASV